MTHPEPEAVPFTAHLRAGVHTLVSVVLAVMLAVYVIHTLTALFYPYPLDYGEAPLVDQALRLAHGRNIYRANLDAPPYTIANYPPLYVLALAPWVRLFGPNFWAGRLISTLGGLATAAFLGGVIYAHTRDRFAARLTALLFLTFPYVVSWSKFARIDLLALALSVGALYVIARRPQSDRALVGTAALLTAAIYTRQSYGLAAPLAAFVWVWTQRDWRAAFKLAGMVVAAGVGLFLILNVATGGGFFFNVVTANVNPFHWGTVERYARELLGLLPILLSGCGLLLLVIPARARGKLAGAAGWPLVASYLAGATLSAFTIGKIGSNVNYLLEFCAALALVAGTVVAWSDRVWCDEAAPSRLRWVQPLAHTLALLLLAVQAGMLVRVTLLWPVQEFKQRAAMQRNLTELRHQVAAAAGPVLADEYMGLLTLSGQPLYIQPFEVTQLANAGLWDQAPFLNALRAEQFPLILIHHFRGYPVYLERWTPEMLAAIEEHYIASDFYAETLVFRPRSVAGSTAPVNAHCPGAAWPFPTSGALGMWWYNQTLSLMGIGYENTVPVYAVADGRLLRRADWPDAVAILHPDPLKPGEQVWTFYGGMASADGGASYVHPDFPPGSAGISVKAGDLLGYQGSYPHFWIHAHFAILPTLPEGRFPAALVWRETEDDLSLTETLLLVERLDPTAYLGSGGSRVAGAGDWLPLRCEAGLFVP